MIQKKIHVALPGAKCIGILEVQELKGAGSYPAYTEITKEHIITFNS
jgi:hypothetical protein